MSRTTVNARKLSEPHKGRTILVGEPERVGNTIRLMPVLVELKMRDAQSAPAGTRTKCTLVGEVAPGKVMPMPVAQATVGAPGLSVEFRLEMS